MDQTNINELFSQLNQPSFFSKKLGTNLSPMNSILDDFNKNYISHFRNPDYDEYTNLFARSEGELHTFRSELFELSNKLDHDQEKCIKILNIINKKIDAFKKENKILKSQYLHFNQEANTSIERTDNYQTIYEIQYMKNWSLLFTIIVASFTTYTVFKPIVNK
jgi:hypothetical protein